MSKESIGELNLDRLIHERARLVILSYLATSGEGDVAFTELRDALGISSGNLSIQLKTLSEAGYLRIDKGYKDNKPFTGTSLTAAGASALGVYLAEIEVLLGSVREARAGTGDKKASGPAPAGRKGQAGQPAGRRATSKED